MWITQMWLCYRSNEGEKAHIMSKTWAQNKKIKYFCSDTVAFQQFLELVLKRSLPALAGRWLILAGDVVLCSQSTSGRGNQRDNIWKEQQVEKCELQGIIGVQHSSENPWPQGWIPTASECCRNNFSRIQPLWKLFGTMRTIFANIMWNPLGFAYPKSCV